MNKKIYRVNETQFENVLKLLKKEREVIETSKNPNDESDVINGGEVNHTDDNSEKK